MILAHSSGLALSAIAGGLPALLYLQGVHLAHHRLRRPWSRPRTASFVSGCAILAVALSPEIDHFARSAATGHMAQHLLLGMFAPIALVLGAPLTLLLAATPVPERRRIRWLISAWPIRLATNAPVATVLNIGGLYVLYLTPLYALTGTSDALHHLVHLHFIVAGCLFTWAITGPDPAPHRPGIGGRISLLVVAGGAHAFLAKLLYSRAPSWPPGNTHTVAELEMAAQWMFYGAHLAELALAIALLTAWYRRAPRVRVHPRTAAV